MDTSTPPVDTRPEEPTALDYPGCLASLETIKERWLNARTAYMAYEAIVSRDERIRRWNNWITLVLSILTALSAALLPAMGEDNPVIFGLTVAMAILTSLSKGVEQTLIRKQGAATHQTALATLREALDELVKVSGEIHTHVLRLGDLDLEVVQQRVRELGATIEETRQGHIAPAQINLASRATEDFNETSIHAAPKFTQAAVQDLSQVRLRHVSVEANLEKNLRATR